MMRFTHIETSDSLITQFPHDCHQCIYIGSVSTESRKSYGDLYVCPQSTVVVRDGKEGWEYESGIHLMLEPVITSAVSKAMLSGYVPAHLYKKLITSASEHMRQVIWPKEANYGEV